MSLGAGALLFFAREEDADHGHRRRVADQIAADYKVPIVGLTRKDWVAFVKCFVNGNPHTITQSFRLGVFEMTVRRLCDLGAMANPRPTRHAGWQVWDADWQKPGSLVDFLNDPLGQYELFAESVRQYSNDETVKGMVGTLVDGEPITLSGLLSVSHRAGLPGLSSWIVNPKDRVRFSRNTTAFFKRGNGLF
jgi:hypothetical protein